MFKGKLGVGIISFNRPVYLKQTIGSLEKQTYLEDTDFYLFQDGAINIFSKAVKANRIDIKQSITVYKNSKLPNKAEFIAQSNIGNAFNQFRAVEELSERYEYFLIVEDDVILSKHYLQLIRILIDEMTDDVFSVSLNFKRQCFPEDIDEYIDKYFYTNETIGSSLHWWAECYSSKQWQKVRPYFLKYMEFVEEVDYTDRPRKEITKFFHSEGFNIPQSSQDAGRDYALWKAGLKRINTIVNRGFYIGQTGMHFTPKVYLKYGFQYQKPFEFESDSNLVKFKHA